MSKFKVGDKVECIENGEYHDICVNKGMKYIVTDIEGVYVRVEEGGVWWAENRFELVEKAEDRNGSADNQTLSKLEPISPTAADFLKAGLKHMEDRAITYDKPTGERSMQSTVEAFKAVTGIEMTEELGWIFMVLLKAVRSQQGQVKADSYEDASAYCALAGEAALKARGK